jgi:hypothetical protein
MHDNPGSISWRLNLSWMRIQSIKQHAWNSGRAVSFAHTQTTKGGHGGKGGNEKHDDCNLEKNQRPAREYLQSSGHRWVRQRTKPGSYKKD